MALPPRSRAVRGFTLIELLVVISVIAVLASLLLPVLGKSREKADAAQCVANLRQIGTAIQAYVGEHDGMLPGPLTIGQRPQVPESEAKAKGSLPYLLAKYLELRPQNEYEPLNRKNVFLCPSYLKVFKKADGVVYAMNMARIDRYEQPAWGDSDDEQQPIRLAALATWANDADNETVNLTQTYAIKDTDALDQHAGNVKPPADGLSQTIFHRDHRNALFFDFHVGRIDLDQKPL